MNNTTVQVPGDLCERGLIPGDKLTISDVPVSHDGKTNQLILFANQNFEKAEKINEETSVLDLIRIYYNATGEMCSPGKMIYALIRAGFKYTRDGELAKFNVSPSSVKRSTDKHSIAYLTTLPRTQLMFPGIKRFNAMDFRQRAGLVRDFLKHHTYPRAHTYGFLLNESDGFAIKLMVDGQNQLIHVEALPYTEGLKTVEQSKTELITQ